MRIKYVLYGIGCLFLLNIVMSHLRKKIVLKWKEVLFIPFVCER